VNGIIFTRKHIALIMTILLIASLFSFDGTTNANSSLRMENVNVSLETDGSYQLNFDTSLQTVSEISISERNNKKAVVQSIKQLVNKHSYILEDVNADNQYILNISAKSADEIITKTYYFNSNEPSQLTDLQAEVGLMNTNEPLTGANISTNISILANTGSESENNGTFSSANNATEAVNYYGLINPAGDIDYYKIVINSNSGGQLKVFLGSLPFNTDYDLRLYNSSQNLISSSVNSGHSDELITLNISGSGTHTYYARVEGHNNAYNGVDTYLLRWRFHPDWEWPVPGSNRVTDVFGSPRSGGRTHDGIDIGRYSSNTSTLNWDYEILATRAGTVNYIQTSASAACGIEVRVTGLINGENVETRYCHLESAPLVSLNANVSKGQRLGWMGNTGPTSTAKHLHIAGYFGGVAKDIALYLTKPGIDVIDDYWDNHPQYK